MCAQCRVDSSDWVNEGMNEWMSPKCRHRAARATKNRWRIQSPPTHSNGGFVSDIVTHAPKLVLCCCLKTSHHIWLGSNFVQTWIDLEYLEYRLHATNQINNHTGVLDKVFSLYYMHHIYGQFRGRIGTNSNFFRRSEMSSSSKT